MKPQDIVFIVIIAGLLFFRRNPKYFAVLGLISLMLSIPFFNLWIFFTAQRLVWYAAASILIAIILYWRKTTNNE
jgi:hypothetical protein